MCDNIKREEIANFIAYELRNASLFDIEVNFFIIMFRCDTHLLIKSCKNFDEAEGIPERVVVIGFFRIYLMSFFVLDYTRRTFCLNRVNSILANETYTLTVEGYD